jgi:hypothetical protein
VILVRDWRDVICSVFAFNSKRNTIGFGRDRFTSDEEYVFYVGKRTEQLLEDWTTRSAISHLVRYEDLVRRPTEIVDGILESSIWNSIGGLRQSKSWFGEPSKAQSSPVIV